MIELIAIGAAIGVVIGFVVDRWMEAQRHPQHEVWGAELNHGATEDGK